MNAIRFIGALALAGMLAGCAGTKDIDPGASAALKDPAPVKTVKAVPAPQPKAAPSARVAKSRAPALPERVAPAPRYRAAKPVAAPRVATVPVAPAPAPSRYVPAPTYEPVKTVAAPRPEPVYQPVESVETVRAAESQYTAVGDLDAPVAPVATAPVPTYEKVAALAPPSLPRIGATMQPIRDDPKDGRNGRRAAKNETRQHARKGYRRNAALRAGGPKPKLRSRYTPAFGMELEQAALGRLNPRIRYDARYVKIGYPWGDVDEATGVCSDVIIRSYRALNIDLQQMVHEDMKRAFRAYPSKRIYGLKRADPNIDHRRVVNLEAFFERTGASIPVGKKPGDFKPGDVLTWRLSGNEPHIGIVVSDLDPRSGYPLVVHNLGAGVRKDDLITLSDPVGHFRFAPDRQTVVAALVEKR